MSLRPRSGDDADAERVSFSEGRGKHLATLVQVFRHRGASWGDFGCFLEVLLGYKSDDPSGKPPGKLSVALPRKLCSCRHNQDGKQHQILSVPSSSYPQFSDSTHYRQPCVAVGVFDEGKAQGLVIADVLVRARRFLDLIGRQRREPSEFNPSQASNYSLADSSMSEDSSEEPHWTGPGAEEMDVEIPPSSSHRDDGEPSQPSSDDEFGDGDIEGLMLEYLTREEQQVHQNDSNGESQGESQDSLAPTTGKLLSEASFGKWAIEDVDSQNSLAEAKSRLKMRAHVLAYLANFSQDPDRLKSEFRRLREDKELFVLHLCGCGLCKKTGEEQSPGCIERSHLKLGSGEENQIHKTYHEMLGQLIAEGDYAWQCGIIHRARYGSGIF